MTTLRLSTPVDEDEARMRRALDVGSHEGRGRQDQSHGPRPVRQFAQDGDVPVVRLQGRKDPAVQAASARLDEMLQAERAAREQAETALKQANAALQALQTKVAHAEMAHAEALTALGRTHEARITELEAALDAAAAAKAAPEPRRSKAALPQTAPDGEDAPVEWWVPGWREGLGRTR